MANIVVDGAHTQAKCDVDSESQPIIAEVSVHVDEGSSCEDARLSEEACLAPLLHQRSSLHTEL